MQRRAILKASAALGSAMGAAAVMPAWARSGADCCQAGMQPLSGTQFDLRIAHARRRIAGADSHAVLVNDQLPAPLLRWREGDEVTLRVHNAMRKDTSIHWHGILLPFQMDGVPGVTFPGIRPGETFTYEFPLKQAGTYWYHSHSGLQEQLGHYGPIVIEPTSPDPVAYDREYVIVLSDWTHEDPHRVFATLKKMSHNYNFQQRTVSDFFADAAADGLNRTLAERMMWGSMRMNPADIADVTGATYTYLLNGHSPAENWTGLFQPGERLRLRFINAAAMSIFNVRIPGLPMTVVQADGLNVEPVTIDEFQIGVAETYDVIIQPEATTAYTLFAESNDRSGYARATLSPRPGMIAAVPPRRPRPTLTMKDMAMTHGDHGAMDHGAMDHAAMGHGGMDHENAQSAGIDHSKMDHSKMDHSKMDHSKMDHSKMDHSKMDHSKMGHANMNHGSTTTVDSSQGPMEVDAGAEDSQQRSELRRGPGVVNVAENPVNRLSERPVGLEDVSHRVLVYTDLKSLAPNPDRRTPERILELHLTSNMERYMWSFDGLKFSEVDEPIVFYRDERLRLTLINNTMMPHPIHLHGMFFDVVTADHDHKPRKHTIVVKPGEKMSVDITADAIGDWSFHCHLLYHMHAGMMRVVSVRERPQNA
ncbi:MAG: copper resistance system multicopper oxidase [Pseudomonadota bacterium]